MFSNGFLLAEMIVVDSTHEVIPYPAAALPYINVYNIHKNLIKQA